MRYEGFKVRFGDKIASKNALRPKMGACKAILSLAATTFIKTAVKVSRILLNKVKYAITWE
jgi:hypothetical protein